MNGWDRLEAFEKMLADVQQRYSAAEEKRPCTASMVCWTAAGRAHRKIRDI